MSYESFLKSKQLIVTNAGLKESEIELSSKLYDFQHDIVRWALRKGRAAIFADCGLGKTPMQLEWSRNICKVTGGDVLILAPLAVSKQTQREGVKFGESVNVCKEQSDVKQGINISNYERLHKFDPDKFVGICLDESSILKSLSGKIRTELIHLFNQTPYRLACTATPSPNDYMELGNHSEFLNVMTQVEMLSMFFVHDGKDTAKWRLKGHAKNMFWKWLSSWSVFVRNPEDIGYDGSRFVLPELTVKKKYVDSKITDEYLFAMPVSTLQERRHARKESIDDRVKLIADRVNSSKDQFLIWCNFNEESVKLTKSIIGAVEVKGADTIEHKETSMLKFGMGKIRVLVTKPKIAGFGMNWQSCHHVIFCGLSDSYEQFYQAVRRCYRFGQTHKVDVDIVVSEAETTVVDNVLRKENDMRIMSDAVVEHTKDEIRSNIKGQKRMKENYKTDTKSGNSWDMYMGDCVEEIKKIKDDSIHFSIFSPPFASLYTYTNSERDMGNCKTNEEFYAHFKYLVKELYRVIMPGRNVSFHCMNLPLSKQRDGFIGLHDLRGELIRMFIEAGWIYHSEVCIWKNPVTAMQRTKALGLLHKQVKKDSCRSRQGIPDYLVTMKKPGDNPEPVSHTQEDYPVQLWQKIASPIWMDINPSDTLQKASARENNDERHICPLQLEVIDRALSLWSNQGDVVLSPFAGIGSEGYQSILRDREFIGFELKESYYKCACNNLDMAEKKKAESVLLAV